MTSLVVRRLLIDLSTPFDRRWNGGDAFRSAYFNALSMSFPAGEQFFIDSVRAGVKALPEAQRQRLEPEVQGFIGQEATHRRVHALFNGHLAQQGHVNAWEPRILQRIKRLDGVDVRHAVAITAATEHFTAILAEHLLAHPQTLDGTEARLRTMWLWHSSEESEHRSTAFDVYRALGGDERWRRRWMRVVTGFFLTDMLRQTTRNLWHDGALWRWSSWRSAASFFFGRDGLVRHTFGPWRAYFRRDFHPTQLGGQRGSQWLAEHEADFAVVARS
ncbi:metal-dependent hydrolase [Piscinibacter sp.]|jgi:predicted metal-dependent hydrolase|uniref:metal-dependent hydrolase n=1 Tax=Piscinibacter sp. TaxID=1903157 RepID=UPI00355A0BFC